MAHSISILHSPHTNKASTNWKWFVDLRVTLKQLEGKQDDLVYNGVSVFKSDFKGFEKLC